LGIELLSKLIKLEPENIAVAKKLAAVLYSKNQSIRATAVLEESIRVSPQDPSLRLMLARLLVKSNDSIRALAIITPPSPLGSESIEFLGFRAALAERLGNYEVAYDDYTRLSRVQRNESRWWLGLAISSERVEAYQMATEAYQRVIALDQLGAEVKSFAQQRINQLVRIQ
jgi:Flp pilus assembly protein TadD